MQRNEENFKVIFGIEMHLLLFMDTIILSKILDK
jgi:hypothetical protein